ncbi:hypothetical protein PR002_g9317 [Phytophthora rubi]|uniref:Uncharacterized protein n=1 Tax=Phytophthora rubi TaxID=129364 RepID=A0A6A3MTL9_9STRA|nr:hypothetical protein PR002_g9317 [Phytophthora rubi]
MQVGIFEMHVKIHEGVLLTRCMRALGAQASCCMFVVVRVFRFGTTSLKMSFYFLPAFQHFSQPPLDRLNHFPSTPLIGEQRTRVFLSLGESYTERQGRVVRGCARHRTHGVRSTECSARMDDKCPNG